MTKFEVCSSGSCRFLVFCPNSVCIKRHEKLTKCKTLKCQSLKEAQTEIENLKMNKSKMNLLLDDLIYLPKVLNELIFEYYQNEHSLHRIGRCYSKFPPFPLKGFELFGFSSYQPLRFAEKCILCHWSVTDFQFFTHIKYPEDPRPIHRWILGKFCFQECDGYIFGVFGFIPSFSGGLLLLRDFPHQILLIHSEWENQIKNFSAAEVEKCYHYFLKETKEKTNNENIIHIQGYGYKNQIWLIKVLCLKKQFQPSLKREFQTYLYLLDNLFFQNMWLIETPNIFKKLKCQNTEIRNIYFDIQLSITEHMLVVSAERYLRFYYLKNS